MKWIYKAGNKVAAAFICAVILLGVFFYRPLISDIESQEQGKTGKIAEGVRAAPGNSLTAVSSGALADSAELEIQEDAPGEQALESNEVQVKGKIALTFDDGPHPVHTPALLDGLAEHDVKATFFLIGAHINEREEIVRRMHDEGHLLGNHTFDHVQIDQLSDEEACAQLMYTNDCIKEITGEDTQYIRPPFGLMREGLDCGIPMLLVNWTLDPQDWKTQNVSAIVQHVVHNVKENDIILLHDYYGSSVEAALQIIDLLQEEYEFVTVDEMLME